MPGTYGDEREAVAGVLAGFSAATIQAPDSQFTPPEPSADPAAPASYIVWEIEYDRAELADFAGGARIDGRVEIAIWAERHSGDDLVRAHVESLRTLFKAAATTVMTFLEPRVGAAKVQGAWYGRQASWPFIRWR